jgi:hypothetical protein
MGSPLLKADSAGLLCAVQKDGTLRVTYSGWDDAKVPAEGEVLEVRNVGGKSMCSGSWPTPRCWPRGRRSRSET